MIAKTYYITALDGVTGPVAPHAQALARTTICVLVLEDGRVVTGSAQSCDRDLACKLAGEVARMNVKETAC